MCARLKCGFSLKISTALFRAGCCSQNSMNHWISSVAVFDLAVVAVNRYDTPYERGRSDILSLTFVMLSVQFTFDRRGK